MIERVSDEVLEEWIQGLHGFSNPGRELALDLLDARRELDEARAGLRWVWFTWGLIEKDLPDVILAAFLAARAAAKEDGNE